MVLGFGDGLELYWYCNTLSPVHCTGRVLNVNMSECLAPYRVQSRYEVNCVVVQGMIVMVVPEGWGDPGTVRLCYGISPHRLGANLLGMLPCFAPLEFCMPRVNNRSQGLCQGDSEPPPPSPVPQYMIAAHSWGIEQHCSVSVWRQRHLL